MLTPCALLLALLSTFALADSAPTPFQPPDPNSGPGPGMPKVTGPIPGGKAGAPPAFLPPLPPLNGPGSLKATNPPRYQSGPCAKKKFCASVFVTAWCPICKMHEPEIRGFLKNRLKGKDAGLLVVVGRQQHDGENDALVKTFGEGAIADNDNAWANGMAVSGFPTYYVQDKTGKVIKTGNDAFEFVRTHFGEK